jgi:hypothetical protein
MDLYVHVHACKCAYVLDIYEKICYHVHRLNLGLSCSIILEVKNFISSSLHCCIVFSGLCKRESNIRLVNLLLLLHIVEYDNADCSTK